MTLGYKGPARYPEPVDDIHYLACCVSGARSGINRQVPPQVVKLLIRRPKNFDFQPGEYVYLNMPSLARYEWHPFTISSAPEFEGEWPDCSFA